MVFLPVLSVKVNLSVEPSVIEVCLFPRNPNNVMQLVYTQYEITKDFVIMKMQTIFEEWIEVQSVIR